MSSDRPAPAMGSGAAGFTLAEVLIAIVVLTVVMTLATQTMMRTLDLFRRGNRQLRHTQALVQLLDDLSVDLAGGAPAAAAADAKRDGSPEVLLRWSRAYPGPSADPLADERQAEVLYALRDVDPRHPARRRVVREVRGAGEGVPLQHREYDLDVAELNFEPRLADAGAPPGGGAAPASNGQAGAVTPLATPSAETLEAEGRLDSGAIARNPPAPAVPTVLVEPVRSPVAVTRAVDVEIRYFVGEQTDTTESVRRLVEVLVPDTGQPER